MQPIPAARCLWWQLIDRSLTKHIGIIVEIGHPQCQSLFKQGSQSIRHISRSVSTNNKMYTEVASGTCQAYQIGQITFAVGITQLITQHCQTVDHNE
jgi:hypothetical protein